MDLPIKIKAAFQSMFSSVDPTIENISNYSYSDNILFKKALRVKYSENTEIPIFGCSIVASRLPYCGGECKEVYIPLISNGPLVYKTAHMILRHLLRFDFYHGNLKHIIDGKGNAYFGCPGIIFNKDMIPIIMTTITIGKIDTTYEVKSINIKVNPCVFSSDGPIEKLIVGKIIPYYTSEKEWVAIGLPSNVSDAIWRDSRGLIQEVCVNKIEITKDIESFIFTPKVPETIFEDKDINDMLLEKVDDIINYG